tara:strand:- start:816 stop:1619 length:804 start_codon:yes stop_codon:yes gene_type:complete
MKNKVVIITGASSGIGKSCAFEFARAGASVVLASRNFELLNEIHNKLISKGYHSIAIKTDVTNPEDCKHLISETLRVFKKIDILINNAGISMRANFNDLDLSIIEKIMQVNFFGTVNCTKYALPYILESKGSIVGVSSIAGHKGLPGRTGYSASKFAMHGFLESLRLENLNKGLHVLIACPGFTASNIRKNALCKDGSTQSQSPRNEIKMMQPERVAQHIISAVKKRKNSIVLTINGKLTVFLNKFFPKIVDSLVYNHMSKEEDSPF